MQQFFTFKFEMVQVIPKMKNSQIIALGPGHRRLSHSSSNYRKELSGYGRIYKSLLNNPDKLFSFYEGQISNGEPNGFGRLILEQGRV